MLSDEEEEEEEEEEFFDASNAFMCIRLSVQCPNVQDREKEFSKTIQQQH
jgi:hypothetical protein